VAPIAVPGLDEYGRIHSAAASWHVLRESAKQSNAMIAAAIGATSPRRQVLHAASRSTLGRSPPLSLWRSKGPCGLPSQATCRGLPWCG
jgi:hypothetical protein